MTTSKRAVVGLQPVALKPVKRSPISVVSLAELHSASRSQETPANERDRYVNFFRLQDLVNKVTSMVKFLTPFEDFTASPLPVTLDAYLGYRQGAIDFIESRNGRIPA